MDKYIKKEAADPARLQLLMDEWPNPVVYYTVTE